MEVKKWLLYTIVTVTVTAWGLITFDTVEKAYDEMTATCEQTEIELHIKDTINCVSQTEYAEIKSRLLQDNQESIAKWYDFSAQNWDILHAVLGKELSEVPLQLEWNITKEKLREVVFYLLNK